MSRADGAYFNIYYLPDVGSPDYNVPYRTIDHGLYERGTNSEIKLRLYYGRGLSASPWLQPIFRVRLGVGETGGGAWRHGTEVVSQGFHYVRFVGDPAYTQLDTTTTFDLGDFTVNSYKDLQFKFAIPDPYPIDETGNIRHGVMHWRLVFSGGTMMYDQSKAALFGNFTYGTRVFLPRAERPISTIGDSVTWLLCRANVVTASEGTILSQVISIL